MSTFVGNEHEHEPQPISLGTEGHCSQIQQVTVRHVPSEVVFHLNIDTTVCC